MNELTDKQLNEILIQESTNESLSLNKLIIMDKSHVLYDEMPWEDQRPILIKVDSKTMVEKLGKPEKLPGAKSGQYSYEWKVQWRISEGSDGFFLITSIIDWNGDAYAFSKGKWAFFDSSDGEAQAKSFLLYLHNNETPVLYDYDSDSDSDSD